jgi:SAM-dependent methyltransferase
MEAARPKAPKAPPSPVQIQDQFYDILAGGGRAAMLVLAYDLGLHRLLAGGPLTEEELLGQLGMTPRRGHKWLVLLSTIDLVEEQPGSAGGPPRYAAGPLLQAINSTDEGYFYHEFLRYWRVAVYREMGAILRGGPVEHEVHYPPRADDDVLLLHAWMRSGVHVTLQTMERSFDFQRATRVLDVGGGDATMACEVARRHPHLRVTVFNVPQAAALGRKNIEAAGLAGRVDVIEGNFLHDPLPPGPGGGGFDLVMFSRVLADWSPEVCRMLLGKAYASLAPGGLLLVCEPFRDQNPGLSIAWEHSYLPYDDFGAYVYKPTTLYEQMMTEAGFVGIQSHPRPDDSIHGVLLAKRG